MRSTPRRGFLLCALATVLASVACGASASLSPTAPSGVGSPSSAGATISGQVNHGSGLAQVTNASTSGAITVTIVGTNISATVDGLGRFTLSGVPEGTLQLQFSGPGTSATLTISGVGQQDQIQIAVTVNGNSVVLESQHRSSNGNRVEVEGRITAVDAAARTLQVAGIQVNVPASADIRRHSGGSQTLQFSDLAVGMEVEVRGTREGAVLTATEVRVRSERQGRLDELEGVVSGLSGTCPALTFTVRGSMARTNGATFFKHASCAQIQNGATVEVKGERQADGSLLAVQVKIENDVNEMELKGMVSGLTGTCPSLSFVVNAVTVVTNSSTRFDDHCSGVQNGRRVEVKGIRQANGELLAQKVETEDDAVNNEVELKGAVSGLTGTCPSLTFVVNAVTVVTNSSTRFDDPCSGVQNGGRVEVKGTRQANGELLARRVEVDN